MITVRYQRISCILSDPSCRIRLKPQMYLHELKDWPAFTYDKLAVYTRLIELSHKEGLLRGGQDVLRQREQQERSVAALTSEIVSSCAIEGDLLNEEEVRSSVVRRIVGSDQGKTAASAHTEGVVDMLVDAVTHYQEPLTEKRLLKWHAGLFPEGWNGLHAIRAGQYRKSEVQVVSGAIGHFKVHYQAVPAERVCEEMERFLKWFNADDAEFPVIKAAIAHLWFVSIHPFEDGNGRIARALTEMLLARGENSAHRGYSLSQEILLRRKDYYRVLKETQHGSMEITSWLMWFLDTLEDALESAYAKFKLEESKKRFWKEHENLNVNSRQVKMLNLLLEKELPYVTPGKWAFLTHCDMEQTLQDLRELTSQHILVKTASGGRSARYELSETDAQCFGHEDHSR